MDDGARDVDAYLEALPPARRDALQALRERILAAAPGSRERIAYGIPIVSNGGDLVGFSAARAHLSLHVMSTALGAGLRDRPGVRGTGATLHFSEDAPLPDGLVEEVVAARLVENAALRAERSRRREGAAE